MDTIFEDKDLLVLNKPSGITVNTSDTTTGEETLQNVVEKYLDLPQYVRQKTPVIEGEEKRYKTPEEDFADRAGIVHRLDKETSGVILVAKNPQAFKKLQAQFKERNVEKTYIALAHGEVSPATGEINAPVGRLPWNRTRFGVLSGGREAVTPYETQQNYVLENGKEKETLTLLRLFPKTGRTHQIRVHLQHIKHPIFADFLYAGRKTSRNDRKLLARVFLHAASITFTHPTTGERVTFEAILPKDLQNVLNTLEKVEEVA